MGVLQQELESLREYKVHPRKFRADLPKQKGEAVVLAERMDHAAVIACREFDWVVVTVTKEPLEDQSRWDDDNAWPRMSVTKNYNYKGELVEFDYERKYFKPTKGAKDMRSKVKEIECLQSFKRSE